MAVWETPKVIPGLMPAMLDFGRIWQGADKIVYSKSRETVSTPRTRLAGIRSAGGSPVEGSIACPSHIVLPVVPAEQ